MTFEDVEVVYKKWISLKDPLILRVVFGTIIGNRLDELPIWLIVFGASSSGKTTIISGVKEAKECYLISSLTPASLASGRNTNDSLLYKIDGKVLIIKDFSTISSMPAEQKSQIMAFLRESYDGEFVRKTGNGEIHWPLPGQLGKFGVIAAATVAGIERDRETREELGERFIYLKSQTTDDDDVMKSALAGGLKKTNMREEIQEACSTFLNEFQMPASIGISASMVEKIKIAAKLIARLRSSVIRDRYTREITVPVLETTEVGARVGQQIKALIVGAKIMGTDNDILSQIILRLVVDCTPINRMVCLRGIATKITNYQNLADYCTLSERTVQRTVEELEYLKILKRSAKTLEIRDPLIASAFGVPT